MWAFAAVAGESGDGTAGGGIPPRRAQSHEGRNHVDTSGIGDRSGNGFRFRGAGDEAQFVAQPLDDGPADEHTALHGVLRGAIQRGGTGGEQTVVGAG